MKRLVIVIVLVSIAVFAFGRGQSPDAEPAEVTIFNAAGEQQNTVFEENFIAFQERTGIDVLVEGSPDFETLAVGKP